MSLTRRSQQRTNGIRRALGALTIGITAIAMVAPGTVLGVANITDRIEVRDVDKRTGRVAPSLAQQQIVSGMGATVRWNEFGTPKSLIKYGGYLRTGLTGTAARTVAHDWVKANAALFKLNATDATALEVVNSARLVQSNGYAVLFRQKFGTLRAGKDGMIAVGIVGTPAAGWKIAYVSSTAVGSAAAPSTAALKYTPQTAWVLAAANVGRVAVPTEKAQKQGTWTVFAVPGFLQLQRARLVAVPTFDSTKTRVVMRAAFEVNVVDFDSTEALGFTSFVDALTGDVLVRHNRVDNLAAHREAAPTATSDSNYAEPIQGQYVDAGCGEMHTFTVDAATKSIIVVATAIVITNDIVVKLYRNPGPGQVLLVSADSGTSPETARYSPASGVAAGTYGTQVCDFVGSAAEEVQTPPYTYVGSITVAEQATSTNPYPPSWKYFQANPRVNLMDDDIRVRRCWEARVGGVVVPNCTVALELKNLASRAPWDVPELNTGTSSFTTHGNNASTAEAWIDAPTVLFGNIGPGAFGQRPVDSSRNYAPPWNNVWKNEKCDPATLIPGGNDILASVTNLFSAHNRMHDWTYFLGFTESNYNLQTSNFGVRSEGQGDPEIGASQAGAIDGGYPLYGGRNNANQLTLQDGVPGLTNQYLFQPVGGSFYGPCVDGGYDMTIVGHEYGHAVSARMVGGPDGGLDNDEGGSMGESWSDLMGTEIQLEHGYFPAGQNPWAAGAYATGNNITAIRNFALNTNPLNYSNMGYDHIGFEVHSDGEVWNAVNYDIRQALAAKYDAQYDAQDAALQRRCAEGRGTESPLPAQLCPGHRRWIQIMFDAFLLMQSDVDFISARDAYLAADLMRFGGANQKELWLAFARRGMGTGAAPQTPEAVEEQDNVTKPSFASPVHTNSNVTWDIRSLETGAAVPNAKVFVGRFEARSTPVADTNATTSGITNKSVIVPGRYEFIVQAPGYGSVRFPRILDAGNVAIKVAMPTNWASKSKGALVIGGKNTTAHSTACTAATSTMPNCLIDDTEATNWTASDPVNADGSSAIVKLAAKKTVAFVRVSALLHNPNGLQDPATQNRFTALRQFAIETCSGTDAQCLLPTNFQRIYTSAANAFPGIAPRPLAPNLLLRTFDVPDTMATHVKLVALHNQCTGNPTFQTAMEDNDPTNSADCRLGNGPVTPVSGVPDRDRDVRAAELQVVSSAATVAGARDPLVTVSMTGDALATKGATKTYKISYTNLGPAPSSTPKITYSIPAGAAFRSASPGAVHNATARTVTWSVPTIAVGATGSVQVTVHYGTSLALGTTLLHRRSSRHR